MVTLRSTMFFFLLTGLAGTSPLSGNDLVRDPRIDAAELTYRQDGPARALPEFGRLLQAFTEQDDRYNMALAEGFLGALHWRLGNFDEARRHLDIALSLKSEAGDQLEVGKTLNVMGLLEWDLGHFDQAITQFSAVGEIGQQTGDLKLQGAALNNLSLVYDDLGDYSTSLRQYEQVLEIYRDADFPRGISDTLGNIGGVHLLLGHFKEAESYYLRALEISEQIDSTASMSQDHGNLGLAYTALGRTAEALAHFDQALELAGNAGMRQEQGVWLRGKANAQIRAGRYDQGLTNHRAALDILAEVQARALLLDALHDMGRLQLQLGDPTSAEQYFQRAIVLARKLGATQAITANLLALGDLQHRHQQTDAAFALYQQATDRAQEAGESALQATGLLRMATAQLEQNATGAAGRSITAALAIARDSGAASLEAEARLMQAELERRTGAFTDSLESYRLAESLISELDDPDLAWKFQYGRAQSLVKTDRKDEAVEALHAAVGHIESVRNRLKESRYRAGYLQDKHHVYIELVRLQLELGHTREAFDTAERLRTWSEIKLPGKQRRKPEDEAYRVTEAILRERIRQLQNHLDKEQLRQSPDRRQLAIETFSRELLLAEQQYQSFLDDAEIGLTMTAQAKRSHSRDLMRQLRPNEALVEYVVGPENTMIFFMTARELRAQSVHSRQQDLRSRLELLRDLLTQRDNELWKTPAASLSSTLLTPLMDKGWLDGVEHIYLVPHDVLNYLPFALLPIAGTAGPRPLVERFTLAYLPAASSLVNAHADFGQQPSMLAFAPGNSRLRHAPEEASTIARLFGANGQTLLGKKATESAFKAGANQYQILHLATHGYFNKLNPLLSGLQFEPDEANDGLLEVHEILEMNLRSDLVTLSACDTGLGSGYFAEIPAGDEFVSLTRAFLQIGSASVLATLWEVEDGSTVNLMQSFYAHLDPRQEGPDKAIALASAQRAVLTSEAYRHPYYWAPFVLVGPANWSSGARS